MAMEKIGHVGFQLLSHQPDASKMDRPTRFDVLKSPFRERTGSVLDPPSHVLLSPAPGPAEALDLLTVGQDRVATHNFNSNNKFRYFRAEFAKPCLPSRS